MARYILYELDPHCQTDLTLYYSPLLILGSLTACLTLAIRHYLWPHRRVFALVISFAWNSLPLALHTANPYLPSGLCSNSLLVQLFFISNWNTILCSISHNSYHFFLFPLSFLPPFLSLSPSFLSPSLLPSLPPLPSFFLTHLTAWLLWMTEWSLLLTTVLVPRARSFG